MKCPIPSEEPRLGEEAGLGEEARIAALDSYNILDTAPEQSFDRITRLAQVTLQVPTVLISLVDRDRQWFKSRQGFDATETIRSVSFCKHAIEQDEPFIVSNALEHPLFCNNPLVLGPSHIRFYIGIPLKMRGGFKIGTLCAIDREPREISKDQIEAMRDLAGMVVDEIELRQIAATDSLTGALTRRGFEVEITREFNRSHRSHHELSLVAVDIDHFKSVNDRYGHAAGDVVLQSIVAQIRQELRSSDYVSRLGGEEFVIALPETGISGAQRVAERIRRKIADVLVHTHEHAIRVTASLGIASREPTDESWTKMLERADAALYEAKRSGRNRCISRAGSSHHDGVPPLSSDPRNSSRLN